MPPLRSFPPPPRSQLALTAVTFTRLTDPARVLYFLLSCLIPTSLVMGTPREFKVVSAKRFPQLFTVSSIIQRSPARLTTLLALTPLRKLVALEGALSSRQQKYPSTRAK